MGKTYSEKLRDPRWQKRRLEILERDHFMCLSCGDSETELHIHHKKYHGEPWEAKDEHLTTRCKHCHLIEEFIKKNHPDELIIKTVKRGFENSLDSDDCAIYAIVRNKTTISVMGFTIIASRLTFESWLHSDVVVVLFEAIKHYSNPALCQTV